MLEPASLHLKNIDTIGKVKSGIWFTQFLHTFCKSILLGLVIISCTEAGTWLEDVVP